MADVDTAVLEPTETAELDETPEEETAQVEQPETDGESDAETETRYSEEEVEERLREALEAKEAEIRSEAEARAFEQRKQQADKARQGDALSKVAGVVQWAAKLAEEGKTADEIVRGLSPLVVNDLYKTIDTWAFHDEMEAIGGFFESEVVGKQYPDWKPSTDVRRSYEQGMKSQDPAVRARARFEYQRAAILDSEVPRALTAAQKAAQENNKKGATAAQLKHPSKTESPVKVTGAAPPKQSVDAAVSIADKKRIFEAEYGIPFPG